SGTVKLNRDGLERLIQERLRRMGLPMSNEGKSVDIHWRKCYEHVNSVFEYLYSPERLCIAAESKDADAEWIEEVLAYLHVGLMPTARSAAAAALLGPSWLQKPNVATMASTIVEKSKGSQTTVQSSTAPILEVSGTRSGSSKSSSLDHGRDSELTSSPLRKLSHPDYADKDMNESSAHGGNRSRSLSMSRSADRGSSVEDGNVDKCYTDTDLGHCLPHANKPLAQGQHLQPHDHQERESDAVTPAVDVHIASTSTHTRTRAPHVSDVRRFVTTPDSDTDRVRDRREAPRRQSFATGTRDIRIPKLSRTLKTHEAYANSSHSGGHKQKRCKHAHEDSTSSSGDSVQSTAVPTSVGRGKVGRPVQQIDMSSSDDRMSTTASGNSSRSLAQTASLSRSPSPNSSYSGSVESDKFMSADTYLHIDDQLTAHTSSSGSRNTRVRPRPGLSIHAAAAARTDMHGGTGITSRPQPRLYQLPRAVHSPPRGMNVPAATPSRLHDHEKMSGSDAQVIHSYSDPSLHFHAISIPVRLSHGTLDLRQDSHGIYRLCVKSVIDGTTIETVIAWVHGKDEYRITELLTDAAERRGALVAVVVLTSGSAKGNYGGQRYNVGPELGLRLVGHDYERYPENLHAYYGTGSGSNFLEENPCIFDVSKKYFARGNSYLEPPTPDLLWPWC
ncbi:hypothetical protein BJ508DRAFT_314901, partial [Ascobolus immersus RN42]